MNFLTPQQRVDLSMAYHQQANGGVPPPVAPGPVFLNTAAQPPPTLTPGVEAVAIQLQLRENGAGVQLIRNKVDMIMRCSCYPDVTLLCDGMLVHCHQEILSDSCGYFKKLFRQLPLSGQVITMPADLKYCYLKSMLDLIYNGQTVIIRTNLFEQLNIFRRLEFQIQEYDLLVCNPDSNVMRKTSFFENLVDFYSREMVKNAQSQLLNAMVQQQQQQQRVMPNWPNAYPFRPPASVGLRPPPPPMGNLNFVRPEMAMPRKPIKRPRKQNLPIGPVKSMEQVTQASSIQNVSEDVQINREEAAPAIQANGSYSGTKQNFPIGPVKWTEQVTQASSIQNVIEDVQINREEAAPAIQTNGSYSGTNPGHVQVPPTQIETIYVGSVQKIDPDDDNSSK